MGEITTKEAVIEFLMKMKKCINDGRYGFEPREKNLNTLSKLGLMPNHVKEYLLQLTYKNYFNGPETDRDENKSPGEIMFFGADINDIEIYIKVKLLSLNNGKFCMCLSFHEAEKPIYYPKWD